MEKNPDYWREGLPKIDKIEYRGIEDENVQYQNLQSGELDIIDSIPVVEFKELQQSRDYNVSIEQGLGYQGIWLNVTQPPFDNKQLRQAVYRLVDRDAIVKAVLRDVGGEAGNSPSASSPGLTARESDSYLSAASRRRRRCSKGGEPDGFSFTLKTDPSPINQQIGQVIQNNLKPAGIDVKLEQEEFGTLLDDSTNGNFQALYLGWSGRIDPDLNIYDFMVTNGDFNDSGYSNPEVTSSSTRRAPPATGTGARDSTARSWRSCTRTCPTSTSSTTTRPRTSPCSPP